VSYFGYTHDRECWYVSLEQRAGSGDDGSISGVFIGLIYMRPITTYVEFYDHGHTNSSHFSKHLMTWEKGLLLPLKRACSREFQPLIKHDIHFIL
jgi:hypothetical protein